MQQRTFDQATEPRRASAASVLMLMWRLGEVESAAHGEELFRDMIKASDEDLNAARAALEQRVLDKGWYLIRRTG